MRRCELCRAYKCVKVKNLLLHWAERCITSLHQASYFHFIRKQRKARKIRFQSVERKFFIFNLRRISSCSCRSSARLSFSSRKANENYEHFSSCEETFYYVFSLFVKQHGGERARKEERCDEEGQKRHEHEFSRGEWSFKRYKLISLLLFLGTGCSSRLLVLLFFSLSVLL